MNKARVSFNLAGCRALVTGSAAGIGRATAELLARSGQPEDYAELIVFLCAGGSYITGETIAITGGLRI